MKNFDKPYISTMEKSNKKALSKADAITKEISQNVSMHLFDDGLVLM